MQQPAHDDLLSPRPRWRADAATSRSMRLGFGLALVVYSIMMAAVFRVPFIQVQPGSATDVLDQISVQGAEQYAAQGDLLYLTVSLSRRLTVLESVLAWFDDDVKLQPEDRYTGGRSRDEVTRLNLALMDNSKEIAAKIALEYLGYEVPVTGRGSIVMDVYPERPAAGKLLPGDRIVAVDGQDTPLTDDVVAAVKAREPGDAVELTIERVNRELAPATQTVEIVTQPGPDGTPFVGVELQDDLRFDLPVVIDIETGTVGGPSAGLAFTLAILDELTPGELTGGQIVAITGAMRMDGTVEPVGGVEQKAVAARRAGAVMMLVPEGEAALAEPYAGSMEVVSVLTLDDALEALGRLGGNALALPRDLGTQSAAAAPSG